MTDKRKRIEYVKREGGVELDPLEFIKNKSSDNARKVHTVLENIQIELWIDKHYHNRNQQGDDNGKREGIEPLLVEDLVKRAVGHLILFGSMVKGFAFVNHERDGIRPIRVVLQERINGEMLNVVIEAHYVKMNVYEVTIKTAICVEEFRFSDNQYCIELFEGSSILSKYSGHCLTEVSSI